MRKIKEKNKTEFYWNQYSESREQEEGRKVEAHGSVVFSGEEGTQSTTTRDVHSYYMYLWYSYLIYTYICLVHVFGNDTLALPKLNL